MIPTIMGNFEGFMTSAEEVLQIWWKYRHHPDQSVVINIKERPSTGKKYDSLKAHMMDSDGQPFELGVSNFTKKLSIIRVVCHFEEKTLFRKCFILRSSKCFILGMRPPQRPRVIRNGYRRDIGASTSSRCEQQLLAPITPQEQGEVEKPSGVIGASSRHLHPLTAMSS
ncbi:hypothetical protein QTO34_000800 [Cnephaeus nilssonii]|uniref:Uncharacterized protein n=1 Tax=Cnephaeus nilssonii TaxID=3371016 RepID=A0AA40ID53_CNENI|nr:hypothetical protein QTO34_000800 [Eptesicus nilssonii]